MDTKHKLHLASGDILTVEIHDYRHAVKSWDQMIEIHFHFQYSGIYDIHYIPASWDIGRIYTKKRPGCNITKLVYHEPVERCISDAAQHPPTADILRRLGNYVASADNGIDAQLYTLDGVNWVILPDGTVINYDLIGEADYSQPITFNI